MVHKAKNHISQVDNFQIQSFSNYHFLLSTIQDIRNKIDNSQTNAIMV